MRTLVFASTKGGVGKTTLSAALAVAAVEDGERVALIDADPQGSLEMWHAGRGNPDNPALFPARVGEKRQDVMVRHAAATRSAATLCIIDTPPAMISIIEPCVRLATLCVVAVRPSPLDLTAIDPVVELCAEHEVPHLFVLNQTTPRSNYTEQAAKLLRKDGSVYDGEIVSRQSYAIAMVRGLTAPETERGNGQSREEIEALWRSVKRRLAKAK